MLAAYHLETGGPEVLRVGEQPDPRPGHDDVLIRVAATSLDRVDIYCREGSHGMRWPTPFIGGRDIAGVIEGLGEAVRAARPELAPGAAVVALGTRAHAELAVAPAALTFPKPA